MSNTNQKTTRKHIFLSLTKSKFLRSVFLQMVLIFLIVIIAVIAIVSLSFSSEINKSILDGRKKQLEVIEESVSKRLSEISSIAYNVGVDQSFYLGSVSDGKTSGYDMSKTLERYLVGNDFIEYLAYYRLSEPDTIYTSVGALSFRDFWTSYLHLSAEQSDEIIQKIQEVNSIQIAEMSFGEDATFFSYVCPLPQFATKPQAFVLIMIPLSRVQPLLESQLNNCFGQVAAFDSDGNQVACIRNVDEELPMDLSGDETERQFSYQGKKYVLQKIVSPTNGWTFVSVIRMNDMISGTVTRQLWFVILLLILMLVAIGAMLACIVAQYKPINHLAMSVKDASTMDASAIIDEKSLLTDTFASLKDDSAKFETAYNEATAASKAKSTFLSNMSHDIRTPMNAIVGMTELASRHAHNPEYVQDCLQKVKIASRYLLDIINNVLDMSRIESGKFTLTAETVSLPEVVYEVVSLLNQSMDAKRQTFLVSLDAMPDEIVIGDRVRLTQVFVNILSNAVKFTPNGGTIRMDLSQLPQTESGYGDYHFRFSDTGVGMSPEFMNHVFDTFSRDESAGRAPVEGTGLGMSIVKNFVELMGGTIQCESHLGEGTTFDVRLHLKLAATVNAVDDSADFRRDSVLILGEDTQVCARQARQFHLLGADAEYALSFDAACKLLRQAETERQPYSIFVFHPDASDPSGVDTVTKLRRMFDFSNCPIVLAATNLFGIDQSAACDAGVTAFVQLPLFQSTARKILSHAFSKTELQEEALVPDLTGVRVLLVEDNEMNRTIAQMIMSEANVTVFDAVDGQKAVDFFAANPVGFCDVILMDVQMPVMDGYAATSAIRDMQRPDAKTIPIYAMTANTFDEDVRRVLEAGMNGHLAKPYEAKKLYQILETVCKHLG